MVRLRTLDAVMTRRSPRSLGIAALAISHLAACATSPYLSSATRDGTFVNRGYGLVVNLDDDSDWRIVAEGDPAVPWTQWPQRIDGALDLDADGELEREELTSYEAPTLRLISQTSTAVRIDVNVTIVPTAEGDLKIDRLLRARQPSETARWQRLTVRPGHDAWLGWCPDCEAPEDRLVALIDHQNYRAEAGLRRQLVELQLFAPELQPRHRAMLEAVLQRIYLTSGSDSAEG